MTEDEELLTLDELCERVDLSVRNVRFYTSRGLVPPPIRRGRSGYYTADHVARLQLVGELQAHGFTLAAIERYLERIPASATPSDIALHRTLLAPWMAELPVRLDSAELAERAGRSLTDDDLQTLETLGIVSPAGDGRLDVALPHLDAGLVLIRLGYPTEAARQASRVYAEHARAIAEEVTEIFRTQVWPTYRDSGASHELLQEAIEALKPISTAALVTAYQRAVNETKREQIAKRTT